MCPTEKNSLKIGLIAGNGDLPARFIRALEHQGGEVVPVYLGIDYSVGQAGAIISHFKERHVTDLVMVGGLQRPNLLTLKVDKRGMQIVGKLLRRSLGDDALLRVIREELESEGFRIHGIHEFMPELLFPLGRHVVPQGWRGSDGAISSGFRAAKEHGAQDLGQSVIIDGLDGHVMAREDKRGTDYLMKSVASLEGIKILVKVSKPQQDHALDLPTIGIKTVAMAKSCGISGIVVEAGATLSPDFDAVSDSCRQQDIFLCGMGVDECL
ncbi:MAG: UDP-2,3-diacylglucosamine diphosphatase LpxI [Pseudobdellovibrionaceae bacterium]|jgi:DUF1009 family protein|nr:UDP-2,3-diacylglucosamine diphosphatase LpxI [Pseudobdellovibrionaceae bacterium]